MDSLTLDLPPSHPTLSASLSSFMATLSPHPNSKLKREEPLDWTHACDPPGVLDLMRNSSSSISYRLPSQQPAFITTISSAAQPNYLISSSASSSHHDIIRHDEFISHDNLLPPIPSTMLRYDSKWMQPSLYKQHSYTLPMSLSTCTSSTASSFTTSPFTSSFTSTSTSHPIHRPSFEATIQDKVQHAATLANESSESLLSSHTLSPHTSHITSSPYRGVVKHDSDDSDDDMQQQQQHSKKRKRILDHDDEDDPDYEEKFVEEEDDMDSHDSHSSHSSSPLHTSASAPQHIRIRTAEDSAHHRRRQSSTKYKRTHKKVQRGQQLVLKSAENHRNYHVSVAKVYYNKWCVRLVTARDTSTQQLYRFVHGPDVAGLVKRKSNISRLLGQYTSPDQKMIMNVPSARCPNTGQPSNVLTIAGLDRLIREEIVHHDREYAKWLISTCMPFLNGETVHDME